MQVIVIETADQLRVERKNVRKGQGRTLGEFSDRDGRGRERVAAYVARKRHTVVERRVDGDRLRADVRAIQDQLVGNPWDPKGTALHESVEKFARSA